MRQPDEQNAKRFVCPPQTYTAKAAYPSVSQGDSLQRLREKCGLFPCKGCCGAQILCATIFIRSAKKRQPVRVERFLLPCKPTDPSPFLFPNLRGQVPAFSRATVTQCVYQALLQQNPVQYARRPTCGKNRDRFRVKKSLQPHTWHIKLFYSKILCSMLVDGSAGKIGIGSV